MATVTPNYSWPVPTSTDLVKDGASAIEALGDAIDATLFAQTSGMTLVKTQTIGTTVSSVTVTDAFSATYENYRIFINGGVGSTTAQITLKLGASTTGYYLSSLRVDFNSTTVVGANNNNAALWSTVGAFTTDSVRSQIDLHSPFLAKFTNISAVVWADTAGLTNQGTHKVATSYTDFTLATVSGTLTGGEIYVYGYNI
jgi:hypothetical protein